MKEKIIMLVMALMLPYMLFAQGIRFEEISFKEAMTKARVAGKYLLVDCYTTWCGPCKMMSEEVFTQAKAGEYFNERFVAVKIDMEKGEGTELAKQLKVTSYPTFLVFKSNETLAIRFSGSCSLDAFIEQVEKGIGQELSYEELGKKYESGKMTEDEVIEYVGVLTKGGEYKKAVEVASRLLAELPEEKHFERKYWVLYENWEVAPMESEHFEFILKNKKRFDEGVGKKWVDNKIAGEYEAYLYRVYAGNIIRPPKYDETIVKEIEKYAPLLAEDKCEKVLAQCAFARAREHKNPTKMLEALERFVDELTERDLWGVTSAFYDAGGLWRIEDRDRVRAVGRKIAAMAKEEDRGIYVRDFLLEEK